MIEDPSRDTNCISSLRVFLAKMSPLLVPPLVALRQLLSLEQQRSAWHPCWERTSSRAATGGMGETAASASRLATQSCLTLRPQGLQHARLLCPSPSPGACSHSCPPSGRCIQPSHLLSSPSPPTLSLFQLQGLFQWVSSLHQVAKVLEL